MSDKTKVELAYELGASVVEITGKLFGTPQKVPFSDLAKFVEGMRESARSIENGAAQIEADLQALMNARRSERTCVDTNSGVSIPID